MRPPRCHAGRSGYRSRRSVRRIGFANVQTRAALLAIFAECLIAGLGAAMVELTYAIKSEADPAVNLARSVPESRQNAGRLPALVKARWDLAVANELAEPGRLHLFPVFAARVLVDFKFLNVCTAAAAYLGVEPDSFVNRTVRQMFGSTDESAQLICVCAGVFYSGRDAFHVTTGRNSVRGSSILHHVSRNGTGVTVLLTCPDAQARSAEAAERFAAWHCLANAQPFATVPANSGSNESQEPANTGM